MAVTKVADIISITTEARLMEEMTAFDETLETTIRPCEALLRVDVRSRSNNEFSLEDHMTEMDTWRQRAERIHALAACFLEHAKSPYFALKKGRDVNELDRRQKEKMLIAPFVGMEARTKGLVNSIDSRTNLCKILLRLNDDRVNNRT